MALDISLFVLFYLGIVLYVRLIGPTGFLINTNNSYPPQPFQYIKKHFWELVGLMFQSRVGCMPCVEL
jgi:hypothetical protein